MLAKNIITSFNLDEVANTLEEGIKFLIDHKISHAEIRTINGKNIATLTISETKDLKKELSKNKLEVSAIASPLFKWNPEDTHEDTDADLFGMNPNLSRNQKIQLIEKIIQQAVILGTNKIRIFSSLKTNNRKSIPEAEAKLLDYALLYAKEHNITLLMENEPVCRVSLPEDYLRIFQNGRFKGLRAWFDIANIYEEGLSVTREYLEKILPYTDYIHIKDPTKAGVHEYKPLGEGCINYKRIFSDMADMIDRPTYLSIETHVKSNKYKASKQSLRYLRDIINVPRKKFALIGTGRVSRNHLSSIKNSSNCELRGTYDIDTGKSISISKKYDCSAYKDLDQLLLDPSIEVVSICTPHDTHIEIAEKAIAAGKTVLCEKPLGLSTKKIYEFTENPKNTENTYVVFQNRLNPSIQELYQFKNEEMGKLQYINITLRWWRDKSYYEGWQGELHRSGGGLITQAIHSIDIITGIFKLNKIKRITSTSLKTREGVPLPDIFNSLIQFENDVIASIEVCLASRESNIESSVFVVGSNGSMKIGGLALSEIIHTTKKSTEPIEKKDSCPQTNRGSNILYGNSHQHIYNSLANKLLGVNDSRSQYLASPKDALNAVRLIEEIENSIKN